jgi:hypothetical protein
MPERKSMEVPYEKPGPPKDKAYGMASVTQALDGVNFPANKTDLMNQAGDKSIEWTKGHRMKLRDILAKSPAEEYPSMVQVVSAVSDVMEGQDSKTAA